MKPTTETIQQLNNNFKDASPKEIISWAISHAANSIITTNFRPYEVAILQAVTEVKKDIPVIWCDTGYNTPSTYQHAQVLIDKLDLNIKLYVPQQTAAHRDIIMGIPEVDDARHSEFSYQVKIEPFKRAMKDYRPDVWFTNLRKGQTALRDSLDVVSLSNDGVLKISPFYHWSDAQLDHYLKELKLPNEFNYFDPTKVHADRECGLHTTI